MKDVQCTVFKCHLSDFSGSPVAKTPCFQSRGVPFRSLVGELSSHMQVGSAVQVFFVPLTPLLCLLDCQSTCSLTPPWARFPCLSPPSPVLWKVQAASNSPAYSLSCLPWAVLFQNGPVRSCRTVCASRSLGAQYLSVSSALTAPQHSSGLFELQSLLDVLPHCGQCGGCGACQG